MQQFPAVTESKIWIFKVFLKTQKFGQSIVGKRDRIGKKMWGDTSRGWPTTSTTSLQPGPSSAYWTGPNQRRAVQVGLIFQNGNRPGQKIWDCDTSKAYRQTYSYLLSLRASPFFDWHKVIIICLPLVDEAHRWSSLPKATVQRCLDSTWTRCL